MPGKASVVPAVSFSASLLGPSNCSLSSASTVSPCWYGESSKISLLERVLSSNCSNSIATGLRGSSELCHWDDDAEPSRVDSALPTSSTDDTESGSFLLSSTRLIQAENRFVSFRFYLTRWFHVQGGSRGRRDSGVWNLSPRRWLKQFPFWFRSTREENFIGRWNFYCSKMKGRRRKPQAELEIEAQMRRIGGRVFLWENLRLRLGPTPAL